MKPTPKKKNKEPKKATEEKFIAEQKYTDRGTVYDDDPNLDSPDIVNDEDPILPLETEEENDELNKPEENENI